MNGWQRYLQYIEENSCSRLDGLMIPDAIVRCWTTEEDETNFFMVETIDELELMVVTHNDGSYEVWRYDFFPQSFLDYKDGPGKQHFWMMSPNYYEQCVEENAVKHY